MAITDTEEKTLKRTLKRTTIAMMISLAMRSKQTLLHVNISPICTYNCCKFVFQKESWKSWKFKTDYLYSSFWIHIFSKNSEFDVLNSAICTPVNKTLIKTIKNGVMRVISWGSSQINISDFASLTLTICKIRNRELGNGMCGMMGTRGIKVRIRGIRVGMRVMGLVMLGMWVLQGIRVGMQGIRVILCENLRVYCFG